MIDINYNRQLDIFDNRTFNHPVHVIGGGATGSWLVMMLAKLGVKDVHVWDFDIVENHNIPNQAFSISDIGLTKVNANIDNARIFGTMEYTAHNEKVTGDTLLEGIVFVLTDTMSSRSEIFKQALKLKPNVKLVIETRMGLDMCRIYNINPMDLNQIKKYEATLYGDEEAEVSACGTSKSVVTSAMTTASIACRQLLNWNNGIAVQNEILYDMLGDNYMVSKW
jgi:molybdopterin/thiamine biosynthesis adenylyltransferase